MLYDQDLSACQLDQNDHFKQLHDATATALDNLKSKHQAGELALFDVPYNEDDLPQLQQCITDFDYPNVFILGTGGSSLGGRSLCDLLQTPFDGKNDRCRLHFVDNVDPHTFGVITQQYDLKQCGFIVISKSGHTAETLCQFLLIIDHLRTLITADELASHFIVITEPKTSPMRQIAEKFSLKLLPHHTGIGGRFAVLTNVGLLPALLLGLDIEAVRHGARDVLDEAFAKGQDCPAALGAAYAVHMMRTHHSMTVMMPYTDRLESFARWYRQLWAESTGKQGHGSTPVVALGTVDQHSQLQLFLDGPKNKAYTLLLLDYCHQGAALPDDLSTAFDLNYFQGKTIGDLMDAEQRATTQTLINHGCPTRTIRLAKLSERQLGGLFMHFMLETMIAAELMGINAFDQPAVEESKILTRNYLTEHVT